LPPPPEPGATRGGRRAPAHLRPAHLTKRFRGARLCRCAAPPRGRERGSGGAAQGAAPRDGKGRGGGGEETPISHPTTYQASAPAPAPERLHRPRAHWPPPRSAPTLEGVRTVRATAAAVTAVMGAGVAAVAVGRFASDAALRIPPG